MADWIELLKAEVERTNVTQAAKRIGYARPSVSLAIRGKYPAGVAKMKAAVLKALADHIVCPVTGVALSRLEFDAIVGAPMPTSNPAALRQWIAIRKMAEAELEAT